MENYEFILTDSLEKVFPGRRPKRRLCKTISALGGERLSLQLAYYMEYDGCELNEQEITVTFDSAVADRIRMRRVDLVPAALAAYREQLDDNYLFTDPCLCPDLLTPVQGGILRPYASQWRAAWIDLSVTPEMCGGSYPVTVAVKRGTELLWSETVTLKVVRSVLPEQRLIYTDWLHADCLADYYRVKPFSETHWEILERFIHTAAEHGVNMLLTPVFTPPLDTKVGGERTTVQLVGVKKEESGYTFDFSLLRRFIAVCRRNGIKYLEISHLFTQWGAKHAPKVIALVDGEERQIFGWDTEAAGEAYRGFLSAFLPELKRVLKEEDMFEQTYFHISDEPHGEQMESYRAAKESIRSLLADCRVIDALSSFFIYQAGVVEHPIVCSDCLEPFLEAGVKDLWTYYCCVQGYEVSNQFMAMPSARNRILGVQLYLYHIKGFLHWGYNFYNSQHSVSAVNPYLVTDAGGGFPSGDPFVVYPSEDGTPHDSLRFMVLTEAMYDLRALERLEELAGRDYTERLIHEGLEYRITFKKYPKEAEYLLRLREKVNRAIDERMNH